MWDAGYNKKRYFFSPSLTEEYPIWWQIAAWPINTFVENNDFTGKIVIPFATSVSSNMGESERLLEELAGTGDWQKGQRFPSSAAAEDVQTWVKGLRV